VKPKKEKLDIELLGLQVRRLANELDGVGAKLRAVALTTEELKILIGELRAVRHLLDQKGQFRHLNEVQVPVAYSSKCPYCGMGLSTDARPTNCSSCGKTVVP
jgi:hypothetical protein